ncbi:MAG TPA: sigma-70 family RNA polymerase sigma factor [Allosphingosinicella sp.]|jgi:RNA polymerase sigma-70 factor (ECF subfamily)
MDAENDLARRAAAGDVAAFTALVRLHEAAVRRFLARLTRGPGADDLAQEAFLRAWRSAADWRGEGSYRGWLLRIAWTQFLSSRRAESRRAGRDREAMERQTAAPNDPDAALDLARALAALGDRERAAASLCFGEGCSHTEAARIMDIPLGTLKSVLARARSALAERLEAQE